MPTAVPCTPAGMAASHMTPANCDVRSGATVEALTELTCLCLARERFTEILGPLQDIMKRDKSPQVRAKLQYPCLPLQHALQCTHDESTN